MDVFVTAWIYTLAFCSFLKITAEWFEHVFDFIFLKEGVVVFLIADISYIIEAYFVFREVNDIWLQYEQDVVKEFSSMASVEKNKRSKPRWPISNNQIFLTVWRWS